MPMMVAKSVPEVGRSGVLLPVLQPTVAGAHDGQVREGLLDFAAQPEMPVYANQRMLRGLVVSLRRVFRRGARYGGWV